MKKSNFIFYWIELAVRRGRRRELGGGGGGWGVGSLSSFTHEF